MAQTTTSPRAVLHAAADLLEAEGWNPRRKSTIHAIDRASGYAANRDDLDAERAAVDAWDLLVTHLNERLIIPWERTPGRTQQEIIATMRGAATEEP